MDEEQLLAELQPVENQDYYNRAGSENAINEEIVVEEEPLLGTEEIDRGSFPAPFGSSIGKSTVDLSDENNAAVMKQEYDEWWNLGSTRKWGIFPYNQSEYQ